MRSMRAFLFRALAFFKKERREHELDAELEFHLEMRIEDNIRAGMTPIEARRGALIDSGGVELAKEAYRDRLLLPLLESFLQDVRYAVHTLRKNPGFTITALLTLALGIGATTAIFSLLHGLAFRNLPVPHPEQLVRFSAHRSNDSSGGLSLPMFEEIARNQRVFSGVFAWWGDGVFNVETDGAISRADIWAVTGNFQSELGATPALGRLIGPDDVDLRAPTATQVAVLGYNFWQRCYAGASNVVGKTIKIEGIPFMIVGVTRKGFDGMSAELSPEVTVPLTAEPLIVRHTDIQKHLQRRDALWLDAAGRLQAGITLKDARSQLEARWPSIREAIMPVTQPPAERARFLSLNLKVESGAKGDSYLRGRFVQPLYLLLGIAGLVLLVACVNLASITLARTASRGHEISVRIALGASRTRVVRQMLTESIMLSLVGMLAGLVLAYWGSQGLSSLIIRQLYIVPATVNVTPDLRILGFAAVAAVTTGILFGMAPAWRATRRDFSIPLQGHSRILGTGTGRLGKGLIVAQVALSLVLVTGAGLFIRTLQELRAADPGFRTLGLLDVRLYAKPGGYKTLDSPAYYHQLIERVSAIPEVSSVAVVHMQPGGFIAWREDVRSKDGNESSTRADFEMVMPGSLHTLGIKLLRGRDFSWQDNDHAPQVAIVSRSFADRFFRGKEPVGQAIEITSRPKWGSLEIVGIVADASLYDLRQHAPPSVYIPPMQHTDMGGLGEIMLVQTDLPASAMTNTLRDAIESLGREYVFRVEAVSADIDRALLKERVTALLSAFFGSLALLLAAIGLYGLMAYNVTRRTREIGIRVALGARLEGVRWLILRETLSLVLLGVAIGLPSALGLSRFIEHLLYGISAKDPMTLVVVCLIMIAVSVLAGWLPARRATRVDPMVALRHD